MEKSSDIIIEKYDRYSRLRNIEWWDQDRIQDARVLVAGAGALGNEVLKNLALVGVGHILIVDFDTVEITNLSRSLLFRPDDVTKPKASLAAQRVRELNSDIQVEYIIGDVVWDVGLGILSRFDVVFGCLDNRQARLGLNRNCWKLNVPWIDGALGMMAGQIRNFTSTKAACYECGMSSRDYKDLNLRYSCQLLAEEGLLRGQVATTPISASIVAAIQVQEFLKILHGQVSLAGHEIEYDGQHHQYRVTRLKRREDCFSHEEIPLNQVQQLKEAFVSRMTAGQLLNIVQADMGEKAYILLDRELITKLTCPSCHGMEMQIIPLYRAGTEFVRCPICGTERSVQLTHKIQDASMANKPLNTLGIPPGHIISGCYGSEQRYYELSGDVLFGHHLAQIKKETTL